MYPIYPAPVRNATTFELDQALVGQQVQVVSRGTTTPYPIFNAAEDPIADSLVTVTSSGTTPTFYIDTTTPADVYLDWYHAGSGNRGEIDFEEQLRDQARAAQVAAEAALALTLAYEPGSVLSVNGQTGHVTIATGDGSSVTWSTLPDRPDTFPPSGHTHLRSEIRDASSLGQQILSAPDQQTFRTLIGAGTGNGTSNLALGTSSTTAAPGNHTHAQYVDSAQAATIADERIAASGGTGGGGSVLVWRYASGAYPTLPATAPAGTAVVEAKGPVAPSVLPSWVGGGAGQVPFEYTYHPELT